MVRRTRGRGVGERLAAGQDPGAALAEHLEEREAQRVTARRVDPARFPGRLHDERVAAVLGAALGLAFITCFLTGLYSHFAQHPLDLGFLSMPASPAWLYRFTQGLHVAAGIAAIPLLLAKLWTIYPLLFVMPPVRSPAHLVERIALIPLVAGGLFQLFTGLANTAHWYVWSFSFPVVHYWTAWLVIGGLIAHIGAKWATTRRALGSEGRSRPEPAGDGLSRRAFFGSVAAAVGAVTVLTVGQTFRPLRRLSLLAPRDPAVGPQGLPINKTAAGARVTTIARDPRYALVVNGRVATPLRLTLAELQALPQHTASLPIACVEGWSAGATWTGVRIRDLLAMAGAAADAEVIVHSLQPGGSYRFSRLNVPHASHGDTLLALRVRGEELHIDHGFPARLIAPNRPGVQQTKWVGRLEVV